MTISIQHDNTQKCSICGGAGTVEGNCFECGNEIDEECEQCYGTGLLCSDWNDFKQYYDIDMPEKVLYKTLDLRQGELFDLTLK